MQGELKDQWHLDQDSEEWLSPRGSQSVHGLFSQAEKQDYIQIKDSAPEGAMINNEAPEEEAS